jgi:adenosylcobinamide kinase/adenosylcobinamide-phosphate guanylyltransferase
LEGYKNLAEEVQSYKGKIAGIFLDCITIMVTNLMFEEPIDWDIVSMDEVNRAEKNILEEIKNLTLTLKNFHVPVVFITNEIGLGIVPENKIARIFRDIAGRVNQYIGKEVSNVYFVTCGIANKIK